MLYDKLSVFKKAYDLSLAIHKRSLSFPKFEQYELASQLRRSSKSICANLGEGMSSKPHRKMWSVSCAWLLGHAMRRGSG